MPSHLQHEIYEVHTPVHYVDIQGIIQFCFARKSKKKTKDYIKCLFKPFKPTKLNDNEDFWATFSVGLLYQV
jgi:hypothetical protein